MLSKTEVLDLVAHLRQTEEENSRESDPELDPTECLEFDRRLFAEKGWRVAADRYSREQIEIIASYFEADADFLRHLDYCDFELLYYEWRFGVSATEHEAFDALAERSYDEMLQDEEREARAAAKRRKKGMNL